MTPKVTELMTGHGPTEAIFHRLPGWQVGPCARLRGRGQGPYKGHGDDPEQARRVGT